MLQTPLLLAALVSFTRPVLGHGQVWGFITETATYRADDAYSNVITPGLPFRKLNNNGPAAPFTGPDITCGPGGNVPVNTVVPVRAGSRVTFDWKPWTSDHKGPVMTYIARCPNGCSTFKGDTGNVWIKIDHDGYDPNRTPAWAEEKLHSPGTYAVTIPAALPNGEYLLRHEVLGLHVAGQLNGAQFYPTCIQMEITNGGSGTLPTGIALPGTYQPNDPGILVELWRISPSSPSYTIPGGPVLLSGGTTNPPPSSSRLTSSTRTSTTTPQGSSTSVRPSSSSSARITSSSVRPTTSSSIRTTTSSASGALQTAYGQCGGQGWTGATACVSGSTCQVLNPYYSQCVPS